jgi:hypothetical protein
MRKKPSELSNRPKNQEDLMAGDLMKRRQAAPISPAKTQTHNTGTGIEAFLQRSRTLQAQATNGSQRGRLIFALDATASRQPTWDAACTLQAQMFDEVSGLNVQLVYYRGLGECRASGWIVSADRLAGLMQRITCRAGTTQLGKVLAHARGETDKNKVQALVFVGDALEENIDELAGPAAALGARGLRAFLFQEGNNPEVERAYREIAALTRGAYGRFDAGAPQQLAELLRAVAAYAGGGVKALEAKPGAAKLLEQLVRR